MLKVSNFIIFVLLIFSIGCSTTEPVGDTEAEVLYNDIKSNYKGKRYLLALEKISSFRSKYPYSFYITEVELLRADIFYEQGNYLEAVDAYMSFKDFHPNHDNLDFIEWKLSESFFNQLPDTVDRDISPAVLAINSYQSLIKNFPKSKHIDDSKRRIKTLEKMLEDKELYIADFYFRTKDFQSASYRYKKIIKTSREELTIRKSLVNLFAAHTHLKNKENCLMDLSMLRGYIKSSDIVNFQGKCENIK